MRRSSSTRSAPSCAARGCTPPIWSPGVGLRDAGALSALGQPRGRKPPEPLTAELARLRQENARLAQRLSVAEEIIAVQKKVSALLGIALGTPEVERETRPC